MTDRPDILRERAARARQHARTLLLDAAVPRLLAYADELDALAATIEAGQPADYDHAPKHLSPILPTGLLRPLTPSPPAHATAPAVDGPGRS